MHPSRSLPSTKHRGVATKAKLGVPLLGVRRLFLLLGVRRSFPLLGVRRLFLLLGVRRLLPLLGVRRLFPPLGARRLNPHLGIWRLFPLLGVRRSSPLLVVRLLFWESGVVCGEVLAGTIGGGRFSVKNQILPHRLLLVEH